MKTRFILNIFYPIFFSYFPYGGEKILFNPSGVRSPDLVLKFLPCHNSCFTLRVICRPTEWYPTHPKTKRGGESSPGAETERMLGFDDASEEKDQAFWEQSYSDRRGLPFHRRLTRDLCGGTADEERQLLRLGCPNTGRNDKTTKTVPSGCLEDIF